MSRLYQINHDAGGHLWCGPAALAAVTGHPTSKIVETVKRITGRDKIKSMWSGEVAESLRQLGYRRSVAIRSDGNPTFAQFRKARTEEQRDIPLIVLISRHFVVLAGNRLVDSNYTDPILASDYHHPRWRVRSYVEVRK